MERKPRKLTVREKRFVEAMANPDIKSQTEAAIKAGYSTDTARITASRLLTKANILEAIQTRINRSLKHHKVTPEEVLGSAVFQMRSSMRDVLDDEGSFDFEKACETGAVDLIKKYKETFKTFTNEDGNTETVKTVEVELLTNQDGRKEVANYIGLENVGNSLSNWSDLALARELFSRLKNKLQWSDEEALEGVQIKYPDINVKELTE